MILAQNIVKMLEIRQDSYAFMPRSALKLIRFKVQGSFNPYNFRLDKMIKASQGWRLVRTTNFKNENLTSLRLMLFVFLWLNLLSASLNRWFPQRKLIEPPIFDVLNNFQNILQSPLISGLFFCPSLKAIPKRNTPAKRHLIYDDWRLFVRIF